jgi:hypothetical protein
LPPDWGQDKGEFWRIQQYLALSAMTAEGQQAWGNLVGNPALTRFLKHMDGLELRILAEIAARPGQGIKAIERADLPAIPALSTNAYRGLLSLARVLTGDSTIVDVTTAGNLLAVVQSFMPDDKAHEQRVLGQKLAQQLPPGWGQDKGEFWRIQQYLALSAMTAEGQQAWENLVGNPALTPFLQQMDGLELRILAEIAARPGQ